jgi:glycopeptide antibiotics resistance protein
MSNRIILLLLFLVIGVVFYFSWLPDPSFKNQTYLPQWLLNWSNQYYNLRTAIPFIAVGFLLEAYTQRKGSSIAYQNKNLNFIQNIGISTVIVCIAEGVQVLIERRSQDLMDVFYGVLGSLIGALIYNLFKFYKKCEIDINLPS